MTTTTYKSAIPGHAVDTHDDLVQPTQDYLRSLNLLPKADAVENWTDAFSGPPQSVAVLEAGATAATKGWATAIGVSAAGASAWILKVWNGLASNVWNQPFALLAVAVVLAAAAVGIAHLFAADVRGRSLAMKATIEARERVAIAMIAAAAGRPVLHASQGEHVVALGGLPAENADETDSTAGWTALAWREEDGKEQYLLTKAFVTKWVDAKHVHVT
jgi:hypothetical protein